MKWPAWLELRFIHKPASPERCPRCWGKMIVVERSTMSGDDMRTYRCTRCKREKIVDFGTATWKRLSDARNDEK